MLYSLKHTKFIQRIHYTNCNKLYKLYKPIRKSPTRFYKNSAHHIHHIHHIHHTYHIHSDASNINLSAFTSLCFSYKLRSYV